ncbi:hypothetical protein BDZ45DRAFT_745860 [Acephala macrosclerotiorum]|nr:hypothetical protein BDZ45DRAFT_745860 [Acephala macrosclerotiorum]
MRVRNQKGQWANTNRSRYSEDTIEVDPDTDEEEGEESEYELEKIVASKPNDAGQLLYLVRWKGWGPEYDEWKTTEDLEHARDLIDIYDKQCTGLGTNAEDSDVDDSDYEEKEASRMHEASRD